MSDIVNRAKEIEEYCIKVNDFEDIRKIAQALAEETYEYGVTYIGVNHGGQHTEWVESTGDTEWDKETLQLLVKRWKRKGQSPKVVRRRVSPPEVME